MRLHTDGSLQWLTFDLLSECQELTHGVFLRHGGYSSGAYDSLNVGLVTGDDDALVIKNRQLILAKIAEEGKGQLYTERQVHGNRVMEAMPSALMTTPVAMTATPSALEAMRECDGLMTDVRGRALLIKHADCQAAIIYDPMHKAVANVHAGWKGMVVNIYGEAIAAMGKRYGSRPEELLVGVSPSLGPTHAQFRNFREEFPESFWEHQQQPGYFDLWAVATEQLAAYGVLRHHIEVAGICTFANAQDFFSYRRDRVTGRNGTVAMLK